MFRWPLLAALTAPLWAAQPYEEAGQLVRRGDFSQAIPLLEKLAAASPSDVKVRNLFGIALTGAGRTSEAIAQFEQVLRSNPRFAPALKNLGVNHLQAGRTSEARRYFQRALAVSPDDPAIRLGLGHAEFAARDFAAAVRHFEIAGEALAWDHPGLIRHAAACLEMKTPRKAEDALSRLPPDAAPALQFEAGVLLARLERFGGAAARFELARGAPGVDQYKNGYNLAIAYLKTGRHRQALETARGLLAGGANTGEIYRLLAQAYEATGQTNEAYEALRQAISINPKDEAAYLELIALCAEHENNDLSLRIAGAGVRVNPESYRMRLQRGIVMALLGRFEDAQQDFAAAARMAPEAPLAHVASALVLLRTGRAPEAAAAMRARVKRRPADYLAHWLLAEALSMSGPASEAEALAAARQSVGSNAAFPQARTLLGKLLLQRGQAALAVQEFEQAVRLDPANTAIAYQLAQAYRHKGEAAKADALFSKVRLAKAEDPAQAARRTFLRILQSDTK